MKSSKPGTASQAETPEVHRQIFESVRLIGQGDCGAGGWDNAAASFLARAANLEAKGRATVRELAVAVWRDATLPAEFRAAVGAIMAARASRMPVERFSGGDRYHDTTDAANVAPGAS